MARKSIKAVEFRRKRQGKTDYKKRLTYLKSKKPRLVVRLTGNHVVAQVVDYMPDGDITKILVNSKVLSKYGWNYSSNNIPASYLVGLLAGKSALANGIKEMVADLGMQSKNHGCRIFAVVKGIVDSGVNLPNSEGCYPSDERLSGQHIQKFAQSLKEDKEKYEKQFSAYLKNNLDPEKLPESFEAAKKKILDSEK